MGMSLSEGIGLAFGVLAAMALVSFLVYVRMAQGGLEPGQRWRVLTSLWVLVLGLIALLFALQALSGGPIIGGAPSTGLWLGLQPRQIVALGLAAVLLIFGYARLRRLLEPLEIAPAPPARPLPPPVVDTTSDDTES